VHPASGNPSLTVAVALAAGVVAQVLARHLGIPGIVLLLASGVLLGPEFADLVRPDSLGTALEDLVSFAIAVILFEGGLNLDVRRLRREGQVIRRLVAVGAVVTAAGGTLAARLLMGWGWTQSLLFGVLVIVTGPTVVTPLVRRIGLGSGLRTILEAEGVFIDAVGALVAVVTLELVIGPGGAVASGVASLGMRLAFGLGAGLLGGLVIALPLRLRVAVPEGLENVLTLALVVLLFQATNAVMPESGILAVIVAGVLAGNVQTRAQRALLEFKEQLTVMLVGLLFVLLAAGVRLSQVHDLGVPGLLTVGALMLVVRPATVAAATAGSGMPWRERVFLAWLAPRGIVAAAVASLFARSMGTAGLPGGEALQALVFLVIGGTVVVQGLGAGAVASLLGLRRRRLGGWAILGANALARAVAAALQEAGEEALLIDSDVDAVRAAEEAGLRVLFGAQLEPRTLRRSDPMTRRGYLALTPREGVNLLLAEQVREELKARRIAVALDRSRHELEPAHARERGATILFGAKRDLLRWIDRCQAGAAAPQRWVAADVPAGALQAVADSPLEGALLPLVVRSGREAAPLDDATALRVGDEVWWLVTTDRAAEAEAWLATQGWRPSAEVAGDGPPAGAVAAAG
jgi:NhaP-type Na+/H+ or K+/H+ antiporter